jgi:hypothetical protein
MRWVIIFVGGPAYVGVLAYAAHAFHTLYRAGLL